MEKQLLPSPANFDGRYSSLFTLVALSLLISAIASAFAVTGGDAGNTQEELETAIGALRSNGYDLFGNAISISDLQLQILSGGSYTFFSPLDSNLISLDMTSDAAAYVQTLRYHVVPRRLTISDLRNHSENGPYLETLLPQYNLLINNRRTPENDTVSDDVTVDGVRISNPNLYLGSKIAVHGLDGILVAGFNKYSVNFPGELGFESPMTALPKEFLSPYRPHFDRNSIAPSRSPPPEIAKNSRFKKRRWIGRHKKRKYQITEGKFSKLNRYFPN